jgi:hypothetical protein
MRAKGRLPAALAAFGLLPPRLHEPLPLRLIPPPATSALCLRS